jgi:hypothetical protein
MHTLSNSSGSEAAVQVFIDSLLLSRFSPTMPKMPKAN